MIRTVVISESILSTGDEYKFFYRAFTIKDKNVLMDIVSRTTLIPAEDTDSTLLERALQKYCRIFQGLFWELSDHLGQGGCDGEMKIDLIPTGFPLVFLSMCLVSSDVGHLATTLYRRHWWHGADVHSLSTGWKPCPYILHCSATIVLS